MPLLSEDAFYSVYAPHYDASYTSKGDLVDDAFYLEAAKSANGPVLEIGCGTGRLLIPTAEAGVEIDGVDLSEAMLTVARRKLAATDPAVQRRVSRLTQGDMRGVRLERRYALVTIPFRPLQEFDDADDQLAALVTAKSHLAPGGQLVFDVFRPHYGRLLGGIGDEVRDLTWRDPEDEALTVTRYFKKAAVDAHAQVFSGHFILRWRRAEGEDTESVVHEATVPFRMSWYTDPQMRLLFRLAGLRVVEAFGSFDRSQAIGEGPEMIYVCEAT